MIRIGTAGWSIPKAHAAAFGTEGTHLQRYAAALDAVEINSSFYRSHKPDTYARWAACVPPGFRFAVKMPRTITHERRLQDPDDLLDRFLGEIGALGERLGPVLVQLPPSLRFDAVTAGRFFAVLRDRHGGAVVCEPRHPSWFTPDVEALLSELRIARVMADPPPVPEAARPGGWAGLTYLRLHGSPRIYYSAYTPDILDQAAQRLRAAAASTGEQWCIFDNTALGEAMHDALALKARLRGAVTAAPGSSS
jgi:uncharacterized protein YecE (DUF72 family)